MSINLKAITMPKWGLAMKEGTILQWFKNEGDKIKKGETLLEIETEKVVNELESPSEGTLIKICVNQENKVPVGSLIGIYGESSVSKDDVEKFIAEFNANFTPEEDGENDNQNKYEKIKIFEKEINFLRSFNENNNINILFIHGYGGDLNNWMFNQDVLSKSFNTYSIDLPGHGQSSKQIENSSLSNFSNLITEFCKVNNIQEVNLVGHSFGAGIAIQTANDNKNLVKSLTLISPIGLGEEIDCTFLDNFISSESRKELKPELEKLYNNPELITRDMINDVLKFIRIDGVVESLTSIKNEIIIEEKQKNNLRKQINSLEIPISIIWGKNDSIIPIDHSEGLENAIKIEIINECGHMAHIENSNKVNEVISSIIS